MPQRHIGCFTSRGGDKGRYRRRQLRAWAIHPGWGPGLDLPKTEVLEDLFYDVLILDEGNDAHRPVALGTRQGIGLKEQSDQIAKLSQQLERSYQEVEEMAMKALETSSTAQSIASLQQMMAEQGRRQPQEK